jgi:hypothetical protein
MACQRGYHKAMRRSNLLFLTGFVFLGICSAAAQVNGTPTSVTSPGFGGNAINGTPASVTSPGPRGYAPFGNSAHRDRDGHFGNSRQWDDGRSGNSRRDHDRDGEHHRDRNDSAGYGAVYEVPVLVPYGDQSNLNPEDAPDSDDQGGPTIYDRHGSGADSYVPAKDMNRAHGDDHEHFRSAEKAEADPPAAPEAPLAPTILVFKDGHQLEIDNYAIVGKYLYDLTPGHARKVLIADLDVGATQKKNDDRGVIFQLPITQKAKTAS